MRFLTIEVDNMFAYYGRSVIDLSKCRDGRNIVVVQGQNGAGKTSLLNAIKLLFLGARDESVRRIFGGGSLPPKAFVLGQPGRWYGVFNTHARAPGVTARVALEWEREGRNYRVERVFLPTGNFSDFREVLNATVDRKPIDGDEDAAKLLLDSLMPKESIPFFFFDGEQIQSMADAEVGRERIEIERLLGFSFAATLIDEIAAYGAERRKAGLPDKVRAEIVEADGRLRSAEANAELAERSRIVLEEEVLDLDRTKRRLDAERDRLRVGVSEEERRRTDNRIAMLQQQREKLGRQIAESVPAESIALANLGLVRQTFETIEAQVSGSADAILADKLHRSLPDRLVDALANLDPPVTLQDAQAAGFRGQVKRALAEAGVSPVARDNPLFASLSPRRVSALYERFLMWDASGPALVGAHVAMLRQARQLAYDERQLRREIEEAEITSVESRQRYAALSKEIEDIELAIRERVAAATEQRLDEQRFRKDAAYEAQWIASRYADETRVKAEDASYRFSRQVRDALEDLRGRRRSLIRASVEAAMNRRIEILLAPSKLVRSVALDDQFGVTYFDEAGEIIARHSLSAGMRQLAAMALLWALKDEAKRPLPVVIDTPLGRIDRENRAQLMRDYFPEAGNPLVLLPTDTEFGREGYEELVDHIADRFVILNDTGQKAKIEPAPIARSGQGA